jgi:phage minor structural protein
LAEEVPFMSFVTEPDFVIYVYDLFGSRSMVLERASDITVEDRFQGLETLTFTVRTNDPKTPYLVADVEVEYNSRIYRIQEKDDERLKSEGLSSIYCEARWVELVDKRKVGTISQLGKTPSEGLTDILFGSGWTVGTVDVSIVQYSAEATDQSYMSLLRQWASVVGMELVFHTQTRTVDLIAQQGTNRGVGFTFGRNLVSISRKYRPPITTRLYAYGANGLSIQTVNPSGTDFIEDYSWYTAQGMTVVQAKAKYQKDEIWNDDRYLLALNLYDAAVKRLSVLSKPVISYSCKVVNLAALTTSNLDDVEIGDVCRVDDEALNLSNIQTRVVRIVRKPQSPKDDVIELAFLEPGLNQIETLSTSTTRGTSASDIVELVSQNETAMTIGASPLQYAEIVITTSGESTLVAGSTFQGTATGAGTLELRMVVDSSTSGLHVVGVPLTIPFTDGQVVEKSWPTFQEVSTDTHDCYWQAQVISGAGTIALPAFAGRAWIITKGAIGVGVSNSPSQVIGEGITRLLLSLAGSPTISLDTSGGFGPGDTDTLQVFTLTGSPTVTLF